MIQITEFGSILHPSHRSHKYFPPPSVFTQFRSPGSNWWSGGRDGAAGASKPFDRPFFLVLSLAVGGNVPGNNVNTTASRPQLLVDWIRVYSSSASISGSGNITRDGGNVTPGGGNATPGGGGNVTPGGNGGTSSPLATGAPTGGLLYTSVAPQLPGLRLRWAEEFNTNVLNQVGCARSIIKILTNVDISRSYSHAERLEL